jgi:outer membrane lipase/esterase
MWSRHPRIGFAAPSVALVAAVWLAGLPYVQAGDGADVPRAVTGTVFFGSSTTDTGNLNLILPLPEPPYRGGRISNGPVWADYFAESMATEATASFLGGTNYALGGARTGVPNFGLPPITTHVSDYLDSVGYVADRRALFLFQTAANDLTAAALLPPEDAIKLMQDAVQATGAMVNDLKNAGARNFVLLTIPELPTVPVSPILPDGTNLARLANDGLEALVESYCRSGTHIALFDLHGIVEEVVAEPAAFGFEVTECSFMGRSGVEVILGNTVPDPCEPAVTLERYMMLDDEHYNTRMHRVVVAELVAVVCSIPAPLPHVQSVCATRAPLHEPGPIVTPSGR